MVRQYQVVLDPDKLAAYGIPHGAVIEAIATPTRRPAARCWSWAKPSTWCAPRATCDAGRLPQAIPLCHRRGRPCAWATWHACRSARRCAAASAELDGEGEVVGGVIVMRSGKNALDTIAPSRPSSRAASQPAEGRGDRATYDRSSLIERAVDNLSHKLLEEFIVVALVCLVFLFHLRSAWWPSSLAAGHPGGFIVMHYQGVNANIMSLGGIAIAIGAMVDAAVVMIENAHKHMEPGARHPLKPAGARAAGASSARRAVEVGPALFFSLLIITLSFMPVFTLEAQEGRPVRAAGLHQDLRHGGRSAGLAVTLVPVLMGY
jgi:Cu(I)/Ag(I) efflux system membrane protein CusA/SilA